MTLTGSAYVIMEARKQIGMFKKNRWYCAKEDMNLVAQKECTVQNKHKQRTGANS